MAIFGRVSLGPPIDVLTTDTVVSQPAGDNLRIVVSAFSLHNTTGGTVVTEIFESPNTTSTFGKRIAVYSITANESVDVVEAIGQGYTQTTAQNLIAKSDLVGVNARLTVTNYTADS